MGRSSPIENHVRDAIPSAIEPQALPIADLRSKICSAIFSLHTFDVASIINALPRSKVLALFYVLLL